MGYFAREDFRFWFQMFAAAKSVAIKDAGMMTNDENSGTTG